MKHSSIHLKENNVISLIISVLTPIRDLEEKYLKRDGYFSLILSRCISLFVLIFIICLLSFLFFFIGHYIVGSYFQDIKGFNTDFWWSLPLVIGLPFLVKILPNLLNRDYFFSDRIIKFLSTLNYSTIKVSKFTFFLELLFFVVFSIVYSLFLMLVLTNFLHDQFIEKISETQSTYGILFTISATIYLTVRILAMEEDSNFRIYQKEKRSFYLWLFAALIIFGSIINDLTMIEGELSIKFAYAAITLLLAIEKTRDSYKKLEKSLGKLIESPDSCD